MCDFDVFDPVLIFQMRKTIDSLQHLFRKCINLLDCWSKPLETRNIQFKSGRRCTHLCIAHIRYDWDIFDYGDDKWQNCKCRVYHGAFSSYFPFYLFPECPQLPLAIEHGYIHGSGHIEGDIYRFTCHESYSLVGQDALYCNDTGTWNGSVPICLKGNNR